MRRSNLNVQGDGLLPPPRLPVPPLIMNTLTCITCNLWQRKYGCRERWSHWQRIQKCSLQVSHLYAHIHPGFNFENEGGSRKYPYPHGDDVCEPFRLVLQSY